MGRWNSNQKGSAASVLFMTRLCSVMWTPSKAWILSGGTVHSLSPNNLWRNTSVSSLTALLFLWTAEATSRGEPALALKMITVPLHFLPHHCVLYGLYRGNRCVAFDLASYSAWIWWWLVHDWNSALASPMKPDSTHWRRSKSLDRSGQNKDITFIQMLLIFLAGFTHFILHCAMKFHHKGPAQNTFPYRTTI